MNSEACSAPDAKRDRALAVDRLTKRFGDRVAFADVSFEVGYGEVFGFLGPNGAGRTTTVRTLGTLIASKSPYGCNDRSDRVRIHATLGLALGSEPRCWSSKSRAGGSCPRCLTASG